MGLFDGILLCTDFDGTLAIKATVSPENAAAIRYFMSEGGTFSIVTGRWPEFIFQQIGDAFHPNGPIVGINGCIIVDSNDGKVLFDGAQDGLSIFDFMLEVYEKIPLFDTFIVHDSKMVSPQLVCHEIYNPNGRYFRDAESVKQMSALPIYNIVGIAKKGCGDEAFEKVRELAGDRFLINHTFDVGIEILYKDTGKGEAFNRLKEITGATLTVAAGDYQNDAAMLIQADIGYAVGNAIPEIKAVADRVTIPCSEHAIARIIEDLKEERMKEKL